MWGLAVALIWGVGLVGGITTVEYNGTTELRSNPERGFRHELDDLCLATPPSTRHGALSRLGECKGNNLTLAQTYCYLDPSTPIDPNGATVTMLENGFAKLRAAGVKSLLRFAYDRCSSGDDKGENNYTAATVVGHISALAAVVQRNRDVVYALQAGFVGCWGEWHGSMLKLEQNSSALASVVAAELTQMLPPSTDRTVMLRYAWDKCCGRDGMGGVLRSPASSDLGPSTPVNPFARPLAGLEWGVVDRSTAHSAASYARIGFDNDAFLCCGPTSSDGGSWQTNIYASAFGGTLNTHFDSEDGYRVGRGWTYEQTEAPYVYMDGEMYWNEGLNGTSHNVGADGHTAAHRMLLHHYTSLSLVHGYSALDGLSHRPPGPRNESIDIWMRTPLDINFVRSWGLPLSPAFFSYNPPHPAPCDEVKREVPPPNRSVCRAGITNGSTSVQQAACLAAGCCFDPVTTPGEHPWCFLPIAQELKMNVNYSVYEYIRDHLGYRLELQSATYTDTAQVREEQPGGRHAMTRPRDKNMPQAVTGAIISFNATVINRGFSAPHTARPLQLVLTRLSPLESGASPIVAQAAVPSADIRLWQPRAVGDPFRLPIVHRISGSLEVPAGVPTGSYNLGLYLPDALGSVANRSAFAIRLANDLPWQTWGDAGEWGGVNVIGTVSIT